MTKISESFRTEAEVTFGHLILLIGISILLGVFAGMFFVPLSKLAIQDKVYQSILSGALVSLSSFLAAPFVLKGFFLTKREPFYIRFSKPLLSISMAVRALVLMLLMLPAASLLGWVMSQIPIPEAIRPVQEEVEKETLMLLDENRPIGIALIFFFLTLVAPFSEEYFFRGGLLGWFLAKSRRTHLWVWLIGLIFSLAHFEWNGLLARWLMGAVLGYIAVYGGLPMAILTHALNNLFVYVYYKFTGMQDPFLVENADPSSLYFILFVLVALATLISLFLLISQLNKLPETRSR